MKASSQKTTVPDIYTALGNKERAQLVVCLHQPYCVTDLLGKCTLSQSALSQHLRILRDAGIVSCVRVGKKQHYRTTDGSAYRIAKSLISYSH